MEKFRGGEGDFYSVKIINPSNVEQRRKLLKYILFKVMTSRNEKFFFPGLLRLLIDTWIHDDSRRISRVYENT